MLLNERDFKRYVHRRVRLGYADEIRPLVFLRRFLLARSERLQTYRRANTVRIYYFQRGFCHVYFSYRERNRPVGLNINNFFA